MNDLIAEGMRLQNLGQMQAAEAAYRNVLSREPRHPAANHMLGVVYLQSGELDAAIRMISAAVSLDGKQADFHSNLGVALKRKAEACLAAARSRQDDRAALQVEGDALLKKALRHQERAVKLRPDFANAHFNRATLLKRLGRWQDALRAFSRASRQLPDACECLNEMGQIHLQLGDTRAARETFLLASRSPDSGHKAYSNYLLALNYDEQDAAQAFIAHGEWESLFGGQSPAPEHTNPADPGRRLNIGYVSPDLHAHSVAYFASHLICAHNRDAFRVFCYSDSRQNDAMQQDLRQQADEWRDTAHMNDVELGEIIRRDGIDILIDLAGHTSRNRLKVFAARPAPLQVAYIGYPNTTGLSAMTHRIGDGVADPSGNDAYYSETLLRLPGGFLRYAPPPAAQAVAEQPRPQPQGESITFGCFNVLAKLSDATLDMWAEVLHAVPDSRLVIKNVSMVDGTARKRLLARFRHRGVKPGRLQLVGWQASLTDHFALYQRIDVALDTWPYNGTTTSCEAMYMGTPVVTRCGQTHASRVGASLLERVGMSDLVADSAQSYLRICTQLAADGARRKALSHQVYSETRRVLCDASGLLQELESAYREIWGQWCASRKA